MITMMVHLMVMMMHDGWQKTWCMHGGKTNGRFDPLIDSR
jgi:hypothetical protein